LIEVMLVLVIFGVMAGLATVAMTPNPEQQLEREARRLQAVMNLAADEALMQGVEIALAFSTSGEAGYQFVVLDTETLNWLPMESQSFEFYPLSEDISFDVGIDGERIDADALRRIRQLQSARSEQSLQPLVLMLSSGEISPFRIKLEHTLSEQPRIVSSDGVAGVELQ
jgi:general secretion pathway protein H